MPAGRVAAWVPEAVFFAGVAFGADRAASVVVVLGDVGSVFVAAAFFAAAFFAAAFLATVFFAAVFFEAVFLAGAFLAAFPFAAVFLDVRGCAGERAGGASAVALPSAG